MGMIIILLFGYFLQQALWRSWRFEIHLVPLGLVWIIDTPPSGKLEVRLAMVSVGESVGSGARLSWFKAWFLPNCVTLDKLLNSSVPQFPIC